MRNRVSKKIDDIVPSPTMEMNSKVKEMKKNGVDLINLSIGELDFDTPEIISQSGIKAIKEGKTRYTSACGLPELKNRIIKKLEEENHLSYTESEIIISAGAKNSLYNVFMTICDVDDEIIVPAPYWVSYLDQIKLAGGIGKVIVCSEKKQFKLTPEQLEKAITPKTRGIVLNSPNNPSGAVYTKNELIALGEIIRKHDDIYIISDEIYDRMIFTKHYSINELLPDLHERTILVNGHSKVFCMTGWRVGYTAAPKDVIDGMRKLQSHSTGNVCTPAQYAAITAFDWDPTDMCDVLISRRNVMANGINSIPGFSLTMPEGAFYLFPNVTSFIGKSYGGTKIVSSKVFSNLLLENHFISSIPGEEFGYPGNIRLSLAISEERLKVALLRIRDFVNDII